MSKKLYKFHFTKEVYGEVEVEARTKEEAERMAFDAIENREPMEYEENGEDVTDLELISVDEDDPDEAWDDEDEY